MSSSKIVLTAMAVLSLSACGPDDTIYLIALDKTPISQLPGSCYTGGIVPSDLTSTAGLYDDVTWSLFNGTDNNQYLDVGANFGNGYRLGDAPSVSFSGLIHGKDKVFTASTTRTTLPGGVTRKDTHTLTITFTDLGGTAKGTVVLDSKVECASCGVPSCAVTLGIDGRQVATQQFTTP